MKDYITIIVNIYECSLHENNMKNFKLNKETTENKLQ